MTKTNVLVGLATLTCAIVAMAAPANAWFEATTPGATKGPIDRMPQLAVFTASTEGVKRAEVACESTTPSKATGFWNIQTSEEQIITKGTKQQQQPGTKVGPHEAITITNWGACSAVVGGVKLAAIVSPCRLQVAQPTKGTAAQDTYGSVQTDCVIFLPEAGCTITVDQQPANHKLKVVTVSASEQGFVLIKANVSELTYKAPAAACAVAGLPAEGNEATFKTDEGTPAGIQTSLQKLV